MREYAYIAAKKNGIKVSGVYKADSPDAVVKYLHDQDMSVVSIQESVGLDLKKLGDFQIGGVPLKDKMLLAKQIATMVGAGVPITQTLDVVVSQTKNKVLKEELTRVFQDVQGGLPLSSSFQKNSKVFDTLQVSLIKAGEKSGNLVEVLEQVAIDLEKRNNLLGKVRGAMIYPVIIFLVMIVVIIVMTVFMIPAVENLYEDFGVGADKIPWITRMFVVVSNFITSPVGAISTILLVMGIIVGGRFYYSTQGGRAAIDKFFLKMPVFGDVVEYGQVVQMTRLLAMLIKSGMQIIDSLKIVSDALSNVHYKKALNQAVIDVSKGTPVSASLSKSDIIPPIVLKMIAIGEDTGSLDKMLSDISRFYETELNNLADNLTKLMEPIILLVVGGVVAVLAVAIYLPIYSITKF